VTAASPVLVGAAGAVAAAVALAALGRAAAQMVGGWVVGAVSAADGAVVGVGASAAAAGGAAAASGAATATASGAAAASGAHASTALLDAPHVVRAVLELALPLLALVAIAALVVHVAQTRALWLPRRPRLPGAPNLPRPGVGRCALDMLGATVLALVCLGWLFQTAPQLARLMQSPSAAGVALASLVASLSIAWIGLGVVDALVRHLQLREALSMTRTEKREDDRLAAADPRWAQQRLALGRTSPLADAVARSSMLLLGDDTAVAIAWDPLREPVPLIVATGQRAHATQLLGLARRHRVPVQREAGLAARLVGREGPVPAVDWPTLAPLVAAIRR
jgi:flagellar biosynthesis protein FlhB